MEGISVVKRVVCALEDQLKDPDGLLRRKTDLFGKDLESADLTLKALQEHREGDPNFQQMVKACIESILDLLKRQYTKYFENDLKSTLEEESKSTRLNNIDCEDLMGMFSAAKDRAPNSTLCYLSSKIRAQKNKTMGYLDSMYDKTRERAVAKSISLAKKTRIKKRLKSKEIQAEIAKKRNQKERTERYKRSEKGRKKAESDKIARY